MATFIKKKVFEGFNTDGEPMKGFRYFSDEELMEIVTSDPSRFFSVPESHAEHVLRKQATYQEVTGDVLEAYRVTVLDRTKVEVPEVDIESEIKSAAGEALARGIDADLVGRYNAGVQEGADAGHDATPPAGTRGSEAVLSGADATPASTGGAGNDGTARGTTGKPRRRKARGGARKSEGSA